VVRLLGRHQEGLDEGENGDRTASPVMVMALVTISSESYVSVAVADLASALDFSAVPAMGDPNAQGRHLRLLGAALRGD
jgi:hypothetical protein